MYPDASAMDRLPPHNRDAERSVLGSMLRDNSSFPKRSTSSRPRISTSTPTRKSSKPSPKLNDEHGKPADIVTVAEWLTPGKAASTTSAATPIWSNCGTPPRAPPITVNTPRSSGKKRSSAI